MTSLRSRLFHGTAVAAALALVPAATRAATIALPTGGTVQAGTVTATGTGMVAVQPGGTFVPGATPVTPPIGAVTPGMGDTLTLTVGSGNHNSAVINWSGGFDIGSSNTVTFVGPSTTTPFSVLNRVTSGNITTIAGVLQGDMNATVGNRGTVFVSNESGITFANSANVTNLTGLVASSLDITVADFNLFAAGSTLHFAGTGSNAVAVDPDAGMTHATIAPDSVLLLVAPKLSINGGSLTASYTVGMNPPVYGDAGFVLASDAKVALSSTSIISIEIDKGTAIGGSVLNGTIGGQRVLVAAASSTDLMASLLGVGGNLTATTATATDHGIVIAVGRDAAIDASNSITFANTDQPNPGDPGARFTAGVDLSGGTLNSSGRIDVVAGDLVKVGGVTATGAATFAAGAGLTFAGDVSAGGLTGSGTSIRLGADGTKHSLTATGTGAPITLTASGGGVAAITTQGDYSINAPGAVTLQQSAGTPANVTQDDSLAVMGSSVSVGDINLAATLPTAFGSGDVALMATTGAVGAGIVSAQGAVTVNAKAGAVTLGGATSGSIGMVATPHHVTVTAAHTATVSGAVSSTGNYTVAGGDVSLGGTGITQSAVGDVVIQAATGDIGGSGTLTADSGGAGGHFLVLDTVASGAQINAPLLNVSSGTKSDVYISTTSDLKLGAVNANQFASATNIGNSTPPVASDYTVTTANTVSIPGAITLGAVTTAQSVTIASTAVPLQSYDVNVGAVSSGGAITVSSATGAVTLAGAMSGGMANDVAVSAAGVATLSGAVTSTGDFIVSGTGVSLGGAMIAQTAVGDVLIKSTATNIGVAGTLTADSLGAGGHVLVLDTAASITGGGNLSAGTMSDVLLAFGQPTVGDVTLGAITARQFASTVSLLTPLAAGYSVGVLAADTLTVPGTVSLSVVTTADPNTIAGAAGTSLTSDTSTTGAVTLSSSAGNVMAGGLTSGGTGDVTVTATGGLATITGLVTSARDYIVTGDSVVLGKFGAGTTQSAQRDVKITSTVGAITAPDSLNLISNSSSGSGAGVGNLTLTSATNIGDPANPTFINVYGGQVNGATASRRAITLDVTASPTGSISLGTVHGASLTGPGVPLQAGGPVALGDVDVASDLTVTSASTLSLTSGVATGNIALGGTAITLGAAGFAKSLTTTTGTNSITLTASAGGAAAITTLGDFAISAPGAVVLQQSMGTPANVTHDNSLVITGSSVSVGDIGLAATPPALVGSGDVVLTANGPATTDGVTAGVITARNAVTASSTNGRVTLGGATSGTEGAAPHDVTVTAATDATVIGAVTSAGDYDVFAHSVTLSKAPVAVTQSAVGNVYVRSGSNIFASGTLVADSSGAGGKRLVLDASSGAIFNSMGGPVNLRAGPAVGVPTSDILLDLGSGNSLTLGTVAANQFASATLSAMPHSPPVVGDYTVTDGSLALNGAITIGVVTTVQSNTIVSHGTVAGQRDVTLAGDTSTTGSVEAGSDNGAVSITGLVSAATSVDLHADGSDAMDATAGKLSVATVKAFGGDATLAGHTGIIVAGGDPLASSTLVDLKSDGAIATSDIVAGGSGIVVKGYSGQAAASLTGGSLQANGAITVTTTGSIDLTGGTTVSTQRKLLNTATLATFDGTATAANADVALTSGDAVHLTALASTGSITLNGVGAVTVPGVVAAGDGATMTGSGNYTIIGGNVLAGGAGITQTATGNVLVRATGTNIAAAGTFTAGGKLVLDSTTSIDGIMVAGPPASVAVAKLVATTDVLLRTGSRYSTTLGDIGAARLASATSAVMTPMAVGDYTPLLTAGVGTLQSDGAITLGAVTTTQSNAILATGATPSQRSVTLAGDTSSSGSVEVGSSNGAVSITGLVSAHSSSDLHADGGVDPMDATAGTLSVATVEVLHGDATLVGGTAITVAASHPVAALDNVDLRSGGAIAVDAVRAGGVITVGGLAGGTGAASLTTTGLTANGGISVTTIGALDLSTLGLLTPRTVINADLSGFNPANAPYVGDASIALTSTASSVKAAAITATGSITLNAATTATITGNVEAGFSGGSGDYIVTGAQVALGDAVTTQKATGDIWIRSTGGDLNLAGTLIADDAGTGGRRLVLDTAGAIAPIVGLSAATLVAGAASPAHRSDVLIRQSDNTQPITLGDITANQLASATTSATPPLSVAAYTVPVANSLTTSGTITLGALKTVQSNTIVSMGAAPGPSDVVIGGDTSGGSIVLTSSNGNLTANGPLVAATTVGLTAAKALTVGDVTAQSGNATLAGGTIGATGGIHAISASGAITLQSPGAIALGADAVSGSAITVEGNTGLGSAAASFAADSLHASGPITVAATGNIVLTGANATSLVTSRATPMAADADATLTSSTGAVTIKNATTTGSLSLTAAGPATATGVVTVGNATTSGASGNYSVTGGTITLGAPGAVQSATGNIQLASSGAIGVDTLLAGKTITADGLTTGSGAGSFSGTTLQANGKISVTTNGAVALTGIGVAETATERGAFSPTLRIFSGGNVADADLVLTSHNSTITVADLASTGATTLSAAGLVTASGIVATGDASTMAGAGTYTVTGSAISLGGGVVGQSARDSISLKTPGAITLTALKAGGPITADGLTVGSGAGSLNGTSLQANGKISVTTNGTIALTGTGAAKTATERAAFDPTLRTFSGGNVADADLILTSNGDMITAAELAATGNLSLIAAGLATATGIVTAGDATTAAFRGNYSVTGGTIVLGAPGVVQSATGNVNLASAGSIGVSTLLAHGSIFAVGPGGATPLTGSFSGVTLQANGAIDVAASGAITLTGTGSARTATERTVFDPTLRTFTLTGAPSVADQTITLASSTGAVTAADLASTGNLALSAGGIVAVGGIVAAGDGATLVGDGNYNVLGSSIALGGGVPGQAALGNISLETPGAITLTALRAGGTITARGIPVGATPTSAASLVGDSLQANGAITVATTGAIALQGIHAASFATERQLIDTNLGGFNGRPTASDANVTLTATGINVLSVPGTISVNGGSSTGNTTLTAGMAGTPAGHGAITATGTFLAGDSTTASGSGDFTASAYDVADGSAATINAQHSISITSQTNDALIGIATAGVNPLVGGAITAQTLAAGLVHGVTGAVASIQSGTTTLGDVQAFATGAQGVATIASATATQGNILADGNAAATVTMATTLGASGDITAHSQSGGATVTSGTARGSVRALAGGAALVGTGIAANGNVDALGGTTATITSGTATSGTAALGNVRATSTGGGLATITYGSAAQSVVASGGSVLVGSATAGDDIVLAASTGAATATTLTVTGAAATETAATDASGAALSFGGSPVTGLGGSNVIIRAAGAATVTGAVSVTQANIAKSANYDILAGSVTLGTGGVALNQGAAGRVDIAATSGVVFAGTAGQLTSNVGGNRVANAVASAAIAGGNLTIAAAGNVTGATTNLVATARLLPSGYDVRLNQPGVTVTSTTGSVGLATITGGPVTVTAPVVVNVPVVTSWGDVVLAGSPSLADTATIMPVQILVDGRNAGYAPANVTVAGGAGAEVTSLAVTNGGLVNALQVISNSGAATLRATPNDPAKITSILVESQTGVAGILNPAGGPASSTNPNTVAAQNIVLRGRQEGSSVIATGPLLATGSILATGPSVTIGTATVAGTPADGTGDILIAATNTASLAAGASETAVARRSINVTGGAATLGDGTATAGTLAVSGSSVTVLRNAVAGDDVVLTSLGAITATNATIRTNGTADLQSGDDAAGLSIVSVGAAAGTGYGAGHTVATNVLTTNIDAVTGGSLTRLAGSNIVATAAGNIDFGAATLTATAGRDIHIDATGTVNLATASAARQFVGASGGTFTATGSIAAGDDLVIGSGAAIDVHAASLRTTGGATSATDARRADGTLLVVPAAGGALTNLAGSNIALAAAGPIQLGAIATTAAPSSLRAFSGGAITTTQVITVSGDIALVGATVADSYALTAGDDIVAVARGGAATLSGPLTTTGAVTSNATLVDLAGNGIALPGEAALGRVDESSILVAATGMATVSTTVASAGRYSVYGRGGITLGTAGGGTNQSAAGDVLLEASIGGTPPPASVTLADGMVLTANSDGVEAARVGGFVADPLVIRVGNGSVAAGGATLRVRRTPNATLADQGTVQIQPVVADGVTSIAVQTLDSASADLRAMGNVTIGSASVDGGLTLASKAGAVALTTLTVGTSVPLMTAAQIAAIDVKLSGATGATLGTVTTGANLVRDITVATVGGDASITTASARDDIVIASATGRALAGDLTFAGTASDSEAGVATVAATDTDGVALADPYGLTGTTITGLAGRNIVVSGATAASLNSVTTAASDSLGDVRVLTAAGPATLTTVSTGGGGLPGRVVVATRNGVATGTTLNASGDIIVDATVGSAVLTSGNAGRDGIVVAPTVSIGTLTAGDDIVAVATGGTLAAGTLTSTGTNSGDAITTVFRADGTSIVDPVVGGVVGNLAGGNVVALATGDVSVATATAIAAPGAPAPGLVRIGSHSGAVMLTDGTATSGDLVLTGATVTAATLSAGRDATITATEMATLPQLTAGRDVTINAGSADLADGMGLVAAQRNLSVVTAQGLTIGTARAGGKLSATGSAVTANVLAAGDALTIRATTGDAVVTSASSTGRPLLADFSGFATSGAAAGATRDVSISALNGTATVGTATAVDTLALSGGIGVVLATGTANFIDVTTGSSGALVTAATAGEDFNVTAAGPTTVQQASAGRDASIMVTGLGTATVKLLTAGRDLTIVAAGSANLGADPGLIAAQRNIALTAMNLTIGSARAGGTLTATGDTVLATTLGSGDALTVTATNGDATVTSASSTGLPLLADFSGFASGGAAAGATRDIVVNATGAAMVTTATAVHSIGISGDSATATTATANTGGTDGDLTLNGATAGATLGTGSGRDVLVSTTSGDVTVGSATALRDVVLTTQDGTATLTTGVSGRDTRVTGSDVAVVAASADTAAVGGDLVLVATGAVLPTAPIFHSFVGNVVLGQGSGRDVSITAINEATATTATASRDLIMTAADVTLVTGMAGRNILLTGEFGPAFGPVDVTSATANTAGGGGILQIRGGTTLKFGSGYDVDIAGDTLTLTTVMATHDVSTNSTFNTTVETVGAGHGIDISGSSVAVTTATANIGATDGDLAIAGYQGNAILTTGAGRDVRVMASGGGSAQAGTAAATRDLFVDARALDEGSPGGTASLGTGTAGRDAVIVGPTVAIGSVTAAANVVAVADAGTLTATTLTSTGTTSGDGLAIIARADGSAVLDPTVTGSPAVGNLAGGNVIALASGDLTAGTSTATAAPGATVLGLVRLASLGTTTVTTATATAGDIVVAGSTVAGGTLGAGRDATATAAAGDVGLATVGSGRDLVLTASNDVAVTGSATAGGQATLTAGRDIDLATTATGDALDAVGNATLVSGRDIIVARPVTVGLTLTTTAGGAGSFAGTTSGGTTTIGTQGNLVLAADTTATGALSLTSARGAITAPDISGNGITLIAATAGTVTGTASSAGGLSATGASLSFGVVSTASDATLHATGALAVSGMTTTGGGLTAISDAGSIQTGAVMTGGPATITASDPGNGSIVVASLGTTGTATLLAGQSATVTGLAQTSGALTATSTNGGLSFGAINSGAAATLRARTALSVVGLAKAAGTLDALSSAGAIGLGSAQASTVTLRGATGVAVVGGMTATGPVTLTADAGPVTTGDIVAGAATSVTATTGAITVASVSRTAGLTVAAATDATVTGDINSSSDVGVTATGGSATIGSVSNAGKLTVAAENNATIGGSVQTSADTLITATSGAATVGGAVKTANYTIKANNGTIALGSAATATQASSGTVILDSQRLTLGSGMALVGTKQIQLDVTGNAAGVSLGDGASAAAGTTRYALSKADLRKLESPTVEIAAGVLPVNIGEVDLDGVTPVAGGFAGITGAFGIRTTGNIFLADRLTFTSAAGAAAPRVLTFGGAAGGADLDKTTTTANAIEVLAVPGLDNSTTGTGGQINATGSTVQLRATYIALGETPSPLVGRPFIDALLPVGGTPLTTAATKTQYVDNATSTLYVAIPPYAKQTPTPQALVMAGTLVIAPGQWALIQNTGPTTTPGGGIIATTVKFNKVAGVAAADPEIAVFGSIAGKTGIASAISVASTNLDGISPNNIRINGCVALSTAGCIQSAVSIPLINLADPGQSLLISSSPDLALSVELITGATNEALWREDDDAPGQNRPQRESRP